VVTTLVCFICFAREAAGALGIRLSPRPLFGANDLTHHSGANVSREREVMGLVSRAPRSMSEAR
jgi:hypothetical protein